MKFYKCLNFTEMYFNSNTHYSFTHFTHYSDVSIVDFEQVNGSLVHVTSITGITVPDKSSIQLNWRTLKQLVKRVISCKMEMNVSK